MAVNFPDSPSDNQVFQTGGRSYKYNTALGGWKIVSSATSATDISDLTDTTNVIPDDISDLTDTTNVIPDDISDLTDNTGLLDSGGATVYADMAALVAATGMSAGDLALVTATNNMYVYSGSGWYKIATVQNDSPSAITGVDGTYSLAMDGTPTVITAVSTDPDGFPLTWSYAATSGSLGTIATVSQADNVFTITPSTTESDAGTFELTFSATDGVNGAVSAISTFTLVFSSFVLSTTISPSTLTAGFEMNRYRANAISDDGSVLATTHEKPTGATNENEVILTVWRKDINGDFQEEYTLNLRTDSGIGANNIDGISGLAISGDGNYIAIVGYNSPQYDPESNLTIFKYTGTTWNREYFSGSYGTHNGARMGSIDSISFSEDGKIILMGETNTPASSSSGFFNQGGNLYTQYSNYDNCGHAFWIGGGDSFSGSSYDHINNPIDWTGTNHTLFNGFFRRSAVGPNALPRDGAPDQFQNMGLQMISNTKAQFGYHVQLLGPNGQFSLISSFRDNLLNSSSTNVGALILCSRPSSGNGQYSYISTLRVSELKAFGYFHGGFDGTNLHVLISGAGSQSKAWYYKSSDSGATWTLMKEFTSADAGGVSGFAGWTNTGFGLRGVHINHAGTRIAIGGNGSVSFFSGSDSTWTFEEAIQHPSDTNFGYDGIIIPNGGNGWENATFTINSVDSNGDRQLNVYKHST